MNKNMMYQDGGNQLQQAYKMLVQKGFQMPFEQFAQLPPEQIQQLIQQVQEKPKAENGGDADIVAGIQSSLMGASIDEDAVDDTRNARTQAMAEKKAANQQKAGKLAGDITTATLPGALSMVGSLTDKGEVNKGSGAAIGSNIASRAGQGAALGSTFGPWGTLIGAGVGAIGGGIEGSIKGKEYRDELVSNTQDAQRVGSLGNTFAQGGYYKRGGYTRQALAERAYARSKTSQPFGNQKTSNKLNLNAKIYAAGSKLKKNKMNKGGNSPWMEDQTMAKSYQGGGHQASMEAEGEEVVLGDMSQAQTYDGTSITNQSSAGGVIKGPDHGSKNSGGSEGVPMDAPNAYIGSKRKTVDGKDIKVKKGGKAPANSVAGKMKKILKDIEKIEKSSDRFVNNPVTIERKKQELAKLRDLAELGKINQEAKKLIKKGDVEGAAEMMRGGYQQQMQSSQTNNEAMRQNYGMGGMALNNYNNINSIQSQMNSQNNLQTYMQGGHPSYQMAYQAPAMNGGYYRNGGMAMYQAGGSTQIPSQMRPVAKGMAKLGYKMNPNGTYQIDPKMDLATKRKIAQYNYGIVGMPTGAKKQLPTIDNRAQAQPQTSMGSNPLPGGASTVIPPALQGPSGGPGAYNPYGEPITKTPTPITSGPGLSPEFKAALARPYGSRMQGGYYMGGGHHYGHGGMSSPSMYNGKKLSFYANGGYHSGTVSNYNPSTGDFDLM